jgi:dihydrofolate reductase
MDREKEGGQVMSKLKLVMVTSLDGIVALGPDDPMEWAGSEDTKAAFRLLTSVGGVLGAGRRTFERLPVLKGRTVRCLSTRRGCVPNAETRKIMEGPQIGNELVSEKVGYDETMSLGNFYHTYSDGWLIGGQTIALEALAVNLIGEVFMCRAPVKLRAMADLQTVRWDQISKRLCGNDCWKQTDTCHVSDTVIEVWRRRK